VDIAWDARDDAGNPVGSGVYFVRATGEGGASITRKAVLIK
jgi:hypothetical protein